MIFRHLLNMRSHPTWVRGLKQCFFHHLVRVAQVAPYVGAWIETRVELQQLNNAETLKTIINR
mgnify:CR=1 FL=1